MDATGLSRVTEARRPVLKMDLHMRETAEFETNLARDAAPLVGREDLLAALTGAFDRGERLVTLVGAGGAGKTHLAQEWARAAEALELREAWFCDLSGATGDADVVHIVRQALGLPNGLTASLSELVERVGSAIAERGRILVVLDNFEHLVHVAASTLGRWLQRAWDATFLVTSRQRLHLPEEHVIEVGPLADDYAIQLFIDRARAIDATFHVEAGHREHVRRIVRKLDALPLAIKMVAPWTQTLSVEDLAERIGTSLELFTLDDPLAPARHANLEATVRWSWALLSEPERDVLQQLCRLFQGRFALMTAEQVVSLHGDAPPVVAVLRSLVERSMLRTIRGEPLPDSVLFAVYQTIVPLIDRLAGSVTTDQGVTSARRMIECAERYVGGLRSAALSDALTWLERHRVDIAKAEHRLAERGPDAAATANLVLARLASRVGPLEHVASHVDKALALSERAGDLVRIADALRARAELAWIERRLDEAWRDIERACVALPEGADRVAGEVLVLRARVARDRGRHDEAGRASEAARAAFERAGDAHGEVLALITAATGPAMDDGGDSARGALEQAERLGDALVGGHVASALATWHANRGEQATSIAKRREALAAFTSAGDAGQRIRELGYLGVALFDAGEREEGRRLIDEALDEARRFGFAASSDGEREAGEGTADGYSGHQRRLEAVARLMTVGGDHVVAGVTAGHLAALLIRRGELEAARAAYERGLAHVLKHPDMGRPAIHFKGLIAALDLAAGRFEQAREGFVTAREWLPRWQGPAEQAVRALLDASIALCDRRQRPAQGSDDPAVKQLVTMMDLAPRLSPVVAMGIRSLRLALFSVPTAPGLFRGTLRVGDEGRWFQVDDEARVALGRSGAICRLLWALARHAGSSPTPLTVGRLFEEGWPGEKASSSSAANRVYATLTRLRGLGLRSVLVRQREGWVVDPEVHVVIE